VQDGTLTDSIAAVEAAWARVAREIGADPAFVIAATHGKRAIDNLARFKPYLHPHELGAAVDDFERSILFYADAYARAGSGAARSSTPSLLSDAGSGPNSTGSSCASSPVQSAMASTEQLVVVAPELADELAVALTAAAVHGREGVSEREWELEAAKVDRAVRILPGVKALLSSIPEGRYAVATSGAKTYGACLHSLPIPVISIVTELG
jgi:beta-phosphoglucomutase-like phosphatase (HAD superfamily)